MPSRSRRRAVVPPQRRPRTLDLAGVGRREPFADLDGGGLARAVGTEQAEALAGTDLEVEPVHRDYVAVGLAELADDERRCGESPACGKSNGARGFGQRCESEGALSVPGPMPTVRAVREDPSPRSG